MMAFGWGGAAARWIFPVLAGGGLALVLAACTTLDGTNALTSFATFEREVMTPTVQGLGLVPKEPKVASENLRGPLVLPKAGTPLPPPQDGATALALPEDRTQAQIIASGLTKEELDRLRRVRVVDLTTQDGRPLTDAEARRMTEKLAAFRLSKTRSIFTPPEQYFSLGSNRADLVCLTKGGDLVAVNDAACPAAVRNSLLKKS